VTRSEWTHTGYAQQIRFGPGTIGEVGRIARDLGGRQVLLVTTAGRLASPEGERLVRTLGPALRSTFAEVRSHVPTTIVQQALLQARRDGVDIVVSFGGGSCADLGKAICFFTEQERGTPGVTYFDRPVLPHISIPTTYSGAELTPFFGMTDEASRRKSGAGGPTIAPTAVVYDPEVTIGTPPRVSAETGMNALAHCVEAAYSPARTPEAEAIALGGIRRIVDALPRVVNDPIDLAARGDMLAGAVLGGRCLQNASMGAHHGLSQLIGGRTGIPHGLANAIILPHALRFTAEAVPAEAAAIATALGAADGDGPAAVDRLRDALELPGRLSEAGVTEDALDDIAAMAPDNHNVANNPRPVTSDDARAILDTAF
jgi:maleylacetate reductase